MDSQMSVHERSYKWSSDLAMVNETPLPPTYLMTGLGEVSSQVMFPARGRKWLTVSDKECLSFGSIELKKVVVDISGSSYK